MITSIKVKLIPYYYKRFPHHAKHHHHVHGIAGGDRGAHDVPHGNELGHGVHEDGHVALGHSDEQIAENSHGEVKGSELVE